MSDEDLEQRLRAFGRTPVDPAVADAHTAAMAEVGRPARRAARRFTWRQVAAAAVVAFLAGSTGLASAGTLPGPAQDVAHNVLGAVGIDVPRSTEGCPEGRSYRNHGEYVSEVEAAGGDVTAAAQSACGKPLAGGGNGKGNAGRGQAGPKADTDGDPCTGPPPWAGRKLSKDERAALQAEHRAQCGDEEGEQAPEVESQDITEEKSEPQPATSTVPEDTTTSTAAPSTTETTSDEAEPTTETSAP